MNVAYPNVFLQVLSNSEIDLRRVFCTVIQVDTVVTTQYRAEVVCGVDILDDQF